MNYNKQSNKPIYHLTWSIRIRSIIMWVLLCSTMPFYTTFAFMIIFLPLKIRHYILTSWCSLFIFLTKHICKVNYQIIGLDNLISEPSIFACNHQSTWETMASNTFLPQHVWIAKHELLQIPFFGWAFRTVAPIAINRSTPTAASQQIITQGALRIRAGFSILVYPEGTRVAPNTKNHPYKTGAARMAIALNLPIIPIAHNAGYIMPRRSFWVYPGLVTLRIGKPIYLQEKENAERLTARIRSSIESELEQITP